MHEQLFREFTERAEAEIALPDLSALEERGRRLRHDRTRAAVAAVAAAVVLVVGTVVIVLTGGRDEVQPAPSPDQNIVQEPVHDEELSAGRQYTVPVWGQTYADTVDPGETIAARFTVAGPGWIWYRDKLAKFGPGTDPDAVPVGPLVDVWLTLVDRIPAVQCPEKGELAWADAATDPLGVARQISRVDRVQVAQKPTRGELLGYPAAHVRFTVPTGCPTSQWALLWNMFPTTTFGEPGFGVSYRNGQTFDLWVLDVEGSMVAVAVDHSPEISRHIVNEANAIVDSLRIDVLRD
jgi:hypothetical protein